MEFVHFPSPDSVGFRDRAERKAGGVPGKGHRLSFRGQGAKLGLLSDVPSARTAIP